MTEIESKDMTPTEELKSQIREILDSFFPNNQDKNDQDTYYIRNIPCSTAPMPESFNGIFDDQWSFFNPYLERKVIKRQEAISVVNDYLESKAFSAFTVSIIQHMLKATDNNDIKAYELLELFLSFLKPKPLSTGAMALTEIK